MYMHKFKILISCYIYVFIFQFRIMFYRIPKRIADSPREKSKLEMEVVAGSINNGYNKDQPIWTIDNHPKKQYLFIKSRK